MEFEKYCRLSSPANRHELKLPNYTPGPGYYGITRDPKYLYYYNSSFPELYKESDPHFYSSQLKGPTFQASPKHPEKDSEVPRQ